MTIDAIRIEARDRVFVKEVTSKTEREQCPVFKLKMEANYFETVINKGMGYTHLVNITAILSKITKVNIM